MSDGLPAADARHRGRVCLVTGAASGIGRRLTDRLVAAGAHVVATDVSLEALRAAAPHLQGATTRTMALDVRSGEAWSAAVEAAVADFGHLDGLYNVAGYLSTGWLHEQSADEVERTFDVNARGVALGMQAAARVMAPRGSGHIVNIGSLASLAPIPGLALYSASKFAVRALSLAAHEELAPTGVAVSLVCPDAVDTPMLDVQRGRETALLTFSGPRVLTTDDVVDAVLGPVHRRRPREIWLPSTRGVTARVADLFPGVSPVVAPVLRWLGRRKQGLEPTR